MRMFLKLFSVSMFLLFAVFAVSAGAGMKIGLALEAVPSETNSMAATRKLYVSNCARCHGADGKSMTQLGQDLDTPDITTSSVKGMSAARMSRIISKGDGSMPAFGKKLKPAQIASIVKYVKTL